MKLEAVLVLLYLDVCCLNRPFDDQTQPRIRKETQAILAALAKVAAGVHRLCDSPALHAENDQNTDSNRQNKVRELLNQATAMAAFTPEADARSRMLEGRGFRPLDAIHLACAEAEQCDRFVTCDKQLLRVARRHAGIMRVAVVDPLALVAEESF